MIINKPGEIEPFWVDGDGSTLLQPPQKHSWFIYGRWIFQRLLIVGVLIFFAISVVNSDASLILWICIAFYLIIWGSVIYFIRRRHLKSKYASEIQGRAQEATNAAQIGSAIHVARHPLLGRDQPVVIALVEGKLSFYSYESSVPLAAIQLEEIQSIQPVVYDDERVPYVEVLDSAAQALQLVFTQDERTWTCVFRRMRPVRPIDWYHAIQQAAHVQ